MPQKMCPYPKEQCDKKKNKMNRKEKGRTTPALQKQNKGKKTMKRDVCMLCTSSTHPFGKELEKNQREYLEEKHYFKSSQQEPKKESFSNMPKESLLRLFSLPLPLISQVITDVASALFLLFFSPT